jgi:hypothetical protein
MTSLLTAFLIMVPAPAEEPPTGSAPTLQFWKWASNGLEMIARTPEIVPVVEKVTLNVNGKQEVHEVIGHKAVMVERIITINGAEVYSLDGKKQDQDVWQKAFGRGSVVAVTHDGQLPHLSYRKILRENTLIFVFKPLPANDGK